MSNRRKPECAVADIVGIDGSASATGVVVVVDVLRAFTTAAWAFARGAVEIWLVESVSEAISLRERNPGCLLMGEVDALPVPGFDLPNSPAAVAARPLHGRRIIHRSSAGTRAACRAGAASRLFAASLVVAGATASRLRALAPPRVCFIASGMEYEQGGEEDLACAELIAAAWRGDELPVKGVIARVRGASAARRFADPARPEFPAPDLELAVQIDRFDFPMEARWRDGLLVLTPA